MTTIELRRKATSKEVDNSLVITRSIDCTFICSVTMQDKLFKKHSVSSFIHNASKDLFRKKQVLHTDASPPQLKIMQEMEVLAADSP